MFLHFKSVYFLVQYSFSGKLFRIFRSKITIKNLYQNFVIFEFLKNSDFLKFLNVYQILYYLGMHIDQHKFRRSKARF